MTRGDLPLPELPAFEGGSVWLVGAGPGDPALLTLAALKALREADICVYDALVSPEVLALAAPKVALEFAGKRGGKPSPSQRDITLRLIELARLRKKVLRLKGGDPFVFGRGAEEARALAKAGVKFRVVPGITAGIGGLAYAGIPATARETNHALILATGHLAEGAAASADFAALAATGAPLILYMAMSNLEAISKALIAGGMSADTPLAIVSEATTKRQRILVTKLATASASAKQEGLAAPAIVAIGAIVELREMLAPFAVTLETSGPRESTARERA
ncbi:MAG: uroporphyrinogen-III C-methyltransferase [Hyphomicrobiales bacterium]|nr:uroporphyrinogen-III C-methyltransferase [Hyphomicrobiales bacterium]